MQRSNAVPPYISSSVAPPDHRGRTSRVASTRPMTVRCPHSWQCHVRCPSVIGPPPHRHAAHPTRDRVEPQPQRGGVGSLQPFGPRRSHASVMTPWCPGGPTPAPDRHSGKRTAAGRFAPFASAKPRGALTAVPDVPWQQPARFRPPSSATIRSSLVRGAAMARSPGPARLVPAINYRGEAGTDELFGAPSVACPPPPCVTCVPLAWLPSRASMKAAAASIYPAEP